VTFEAATAPLMPRAISLSRARCSGSGDPDRLAFKEYLIQAVVTFNRYEIQTPLVRQ
jgi:hypothetical protein